MFLSRNPHTWRNGTRRIAPEAVERAAFLPAQPFGPAPLHSTGGLQRGLPSMASGDNRGRPKRGHSRSSRLPTSPGNNRPRRRSCIVGTADPGTVGGPPMAIDTLHLARTMQRIAAEIDAHCRPASAVRRTFDAAPFGTAHVCVSPGEESQFASSNHNRIYVCGTEGGLTREGLAQLCGMFEAAGVGRFFVWLTPGPGMESVRGWLAEAGMARNPHVTYPTLARPAGAPEPVSSDLEVRELAGEDAAQTLASVDGASWRDFRRSVGAPGFSHYVAYEGGRPIGSAALQVHDDVGHLCMASRRSRTAGAARSRR